MTARPARAQIKVLFFLRIAHLDRMYPSLFETLLERGHDVTVVVERERILQPGAAGVIEELAGRYPSSFSVEKLAKPYDRWRHIRGALRMGVDYLRYFDSAYANAARLRRRAAAKTPWPVRGAVRLVARSATSRERLRRLLLRLDLALPLGPDWADEVRRHAPDVVLVSPLISAGSPQSNWIRVARQLGIPTVFPVASWDNLTNKGVVKEAPSLTIVWNEAQADEAVQLQRLPRERVVVTGAHSFDHWFERTPSTTHAELAASVGLPDDSPFFVYVCSSQFIAGDERPFVRDWLAHLRSSDDSLLQGVNVIVRPHPFNARDWRDASLDDPRTVISPREGSVPTDETRRAEYFDTIHHSAGVVGISTSVFVEAAIAGRPSFTLVTPAYRETQRGTLHFDLVAGERGVLVVAETWEQHLEQLGRQLREPAAHAARIDCFVDSFVRPLGRDRSGAQVAIDAIEALVPPRTGSQPPFATQATR